MDIEALLSNMSNNYHDNFTPLSTPSLSLTFQGHSRSNLMTYLDSQYMSCPLCAVVTYV